MAMSPTDFYPPGPPTGGAALDQTARDAAAAAQATANAAVSTGAELAPLLATPEAGPPISAKVRTLGYASVADEAYGAKCDAVVLPGVTVSLATPTTATTAAPHGLTAADVGKVIAIPRAGVARDLLCGVTAASGTSITLDTAATRTVSAATGAIIKNGSGQGGKVTGTLSINAGTTALTDSTGGRSYTAGVDQMAVLVQGAYSDVLVTTVAGVPSGTTITLALAASTAVTGGTALVHTDDTAAVQAAITATVGTGKRLVIPASCGHGPVAITGPIHLEAARGAVVYPVWSAAAVYERQYQATGDRVTLEGITVDGTYAPTLSLDTKDVFTGKTCKRFRVLACAVRNALTTEGNVAGGLTGINAGAVNLKTVRGVALDTVSHWAVRDCSFDTMSGPGVFTRDSIHGVIADNYFNDLRWYSVAIDRGGDRIAIRDNTFLGTFPLANHWGGPVNLMSQNGGARNKRIHVYSNYFSCVCDYGMVIRLLSLEQSKVFNNTIENCPAGAQTGGPLQCIGLDTRQAAGAGDNGPCKHVEIYGNIMLSRNVQDGIYCKNQADGARAARDPALNIWVHHNTVLSTDATDNFEGAVWFHGIDGGFDGVKVERNRATVITKAGSAVPGAVGFVSTNAQGRIDHAEIVGNEVEDIGAAIPTQSIQVGVYLQTFADNVTFGPGNRVKNFFYPYRTLAGLGTITGISGIEQDSCTSAPLLNTAEAFRLPRVIYGTVPPISGQNQVGDEVHLSNAAASGSGKLICTTAGANAVHLWATGTTYNVGDWIRNASNRVYKVTTAPGAPTSTVAPSAIVVGGTETIDGYVWQCMSTTAAKWSPVTLGAALVLPA